MWGNVEKPGGSLLASRDHGGPPRGAVPRGKDGEKLEKRGKGGNGGEKKAMMFKFLHTKTQWIPGVGPLLGRRLAAAGLHDFFDVLANLPTGYETYTPGIFPKEGPVYMEVRLGTLYGRHPWKIPCTTSRGESLDLIFFHAPKGIWRLKETLWIKGRITTSLRGSPNILHPEGVTPWLGPSGALLILPEYALPKGISNLRFSRWVRHILDAWPEISWSPLPGCTRFMPKDTPAQAPEEGLAQGILGWACGNPQEKACGASRKAEGLHLGLEKKEGPHSSASHFGQDPFPGELPLSWYTCFQRAHFPSDREMIGENALWRQTLAHDEGVVQYVAAAQGATEDMLCHLGQEIEENIGGDQGREMKEGETAPGLEEKEEQGPKMKKTGARHERVALQTQNLGRGEGSRRDLGRGKGSRGGEDDDAGIAEKSPAGRRDPGLEDGREEEDGAGTREKGEETGTRGHPRAPSNSNPGAMDNFLKCFSHPLTPSQARAWSILTQDLCGSRPMRRLIHGDVGSGKTLLAFLALIQVAASGKQACLMAPTETLIRQHFAALTTWLRDIPVLLIVGNHQRVGPTEAPIILGTHALLYDSVTFRDLALIVIDEQQRFGVQQRLSLQKKGHNPHMLFLSATPIPRTFQRLICGQMDTSIIERRPTTLPVSSYLVSMAKMQDFYLWIQKCLAQRERVYWVCPTIEDEHSGVLRRWDYWNGFFPGLVGFLHGGLSLEEKEGVMEAFRRGEKPILVATTVIEVGIDVPQASTIFIEESVRFGLSQLHQLRGRVGRGTCGGHCFFLYTPELSTQGRQRLHFMRTCQDGFKIAEQDLLWRGGGTPWGTAQSGHATLRLVKKCPPSILVSSAQGAAHLLEHHGESRENLLRLWGIAGREILAAG